MVKFGFKNGFQRYQCRVCKRTRSDIPENPLVNLRVPFEKAVQVVKLLTTDGLYGYLPAVYDTFGANVDFAQQVKTYNDRDFGAFRDERRYSVARGCKS